MGDIIHGTIDMLGGTVSWMSLFLSTTSPGLAWAVVVGIPAILYIWQIVEDYGDMCDFPDRDPSWNRSLKMSFGLYLFAILLHWHFFEKLYPGWLYYGIPIVFVVHLLMLTRAKFNDAVRSIIGPYKTKEKELEEEKRKHEARMKTLESNAAIRELLCKQREDRLLSATSGSVPFDGLAKAVADLKAVMYKECESYLRNKSRPARSSADIVKGLRVKAKESEYRYNLMLYRYEFLIKKFPELEKYVESMDAIHGLVDYSSLSEAEQNYDRVRDWLSKEEYEKLSVDERNQLALDKYISHFKKSSWQVGRDYELYIGYLYRKEGWAVSQFGIEMSLGDMGRDIIAKKGEITHIVQCKRWGKDKMIHENVICQLYGTSIQYDLDRSRGSGNLPNVEKVIPVLFTTTALSKTAQRFSDRLGVIVKVVPMCENYPRIKCNINNGHKIYHLPFDQQYDRVHIDKPGEFYAATVKEASSMGFRRAYRYTGLGQTRK